MPLMKETFHHHDDLFIFDRGEMPEPTSCHTS
jgi:hypothetical protein